LSTGTRKLVDGSALVAVVLATGAALVWAFEHDSPDWLDAITKAFALLATGAFFVYKVVAGYQKIDLRLSLRCERSAIDSNTDLLVVFASLEKGDRGSMRIHDMQARFTWPDTTPNVVPFVGFERLSCNTKNTGPDTGRKLLEWSRPNSHSPFISLPPGDAVQFACASKIPRLAVGTIEVAVLGVMRGSAAVAQWRSSYVSAPQSTESHVFAPPSTVARP
jgi:hypothetical protein